MKTKTFVILFMQLLCMTIRAQDDGTTMMPIIEKTESMVKYIEGEANQEIVRIETDILATSKTTFRNMQQGYTYNVIAYGDYRFKDIDVVVYRWNGSGWVVMNKDSDNNAIAMVTIIPTTTSDYKIEISAYKFNSGYTAGHYGLIICHEKK